MRYTVLSAALLASGTAWAQPAAKPTDPQIAHIAYTADNIDIKAGELAAKKSKNKDVVAFANDMVRDHTAVNEKALALLKKLNVQPQDNDTSKSLTKDADAEMQKLNALEGAAFDKEYAQHEVAYHRAVNDALRTTLIPAASNTELKDLLSTGLKLFEGHQQHAEHLAGELK
jgi:putative membrane protein